jgi:hypothetical protein
VGKRCGKMRALVVLLLLIPQFALAFPIIMAPVAGYDVAVHCSLSERTQQNDNALVEVNVIYENGTYISGAQVHAEAHWWVLRLLNQTWNHPLICFTAIANEEYVNWTINVNEHPTFKWTWIPRAVGEHELAYVAFPTSAGNANIQFYNANAIATSSLPEFPPVAATMTTILALAIVFCVTRSLRVRRKN